MRRKMNGEKEKEGMNFVSEEKVEREIEARKK